MFLSNVQSLWSKFDELVVFAGSIKPDVIALTESWLSSSVDDSQIAIPGYSLPFRHDREEYRRGGGTCCYVRMEISCVLIPTLSKCPSFMESVWLEFPSSKTILAIFYIPPNLAVSQNKEAIEYIVREVDYITSDREKHHLILAGDFNNVPTGDLECLLGLVQTVKEPTRGAAILDKIFVSSDLAEKLSSPIVGPNFGKSDHKSVIVRPLVDAQCKSSFVKLFDFRKSNIDRFITKLATVPWHKIYTLEKPVQEKCNLFYEWLYGCMKEIPQYYVEMKESDKPWLTPLLKRLINLKHEAYRNKEFDLYLHYRKKLQFEIPLAKSHWVNRQKESPKKLWNIVKGISNRKQNDVNKLVTQFDSVHEAAEAINDIFVESFTPKTISQPDQQVAGDNEWKVDTSVETIFKELTALNMKKATGSDGIPVRLLKEAATILTEPLSHLLTSSVLECEIPIQWKTTNVIPIPKSKNPTLNDLRPISLLPIMGKILEKCVLRSVKEELLQLYGPNQFGFRPESSTLCALVSLLDFTTREMDKKKCAGVALISFDMSKAFDKLSHEHLLKTLSKTTLPPTCLQWCMNYLHERRQRVILPDGTTSTYRPVTSGVPQGAILSPYLFATHMGSLTPASENTGMIKFADDVAIAIPYEDRAFLKEQVEAEITNMDTWCKDNGLVLNEKKTKLLLCDKKNIMIPIPDLEVSDQMKILGVTLQSNLKWNAHIENVSKVASRRIYLLKVLKRLPVQKKELVQIYVSHIQSLLEYNAPLFTGLSRRSTTILEKLRRRCHRVICGFECNCDILRSLELRREEKALAFFKKMLKTDHILHHLCPRIHSHSTHVIMPFSRTERRAKSFIPYCSYRYNCSLMMK